MIKRNHTNAASINVLAERELDQVVGGHCTSRHGTVLPSAGSSAPGVPGVDPGGLGVSPAPGVEISPAAPGVEGAPAQGTEIRFGR